MHCQKSDTVIVKSLAFCVLFICYFFGRSQNIEYRQFTSANGLLSDKVYNIYQDKNGYLWIFSEYGTLKYDGEEFRRVLTNLPLSEAFIYSIYEREDGRMWVANARANVYEVVNDSAYQLHGFEETSAILRKNVSEIVKLAVSGNDEIYLITKAGSYLLKPKRGSFLSENLTNKICTDSVKIHLYELNGELLPVHARRENDEYLSLWKNKQRYITFEGSSRKVKIKYDPYTVPFRHFRKKNNKIYYTKAGSIGIIRPDNSSFEIDLKYTVLNFRFDKKGHTWVGLLNGGICELDERDSIVGRYLRGITVDDIEIDFQNGVWASTAGGGLFRFNNLVLEEFREVSQGTSIIFSKQSKANVLLANARGELFLIAEDGKTKIKSSGAEDIVSATEQGESVFLSYPHFIEKISVQGKKIRSEIYLSKSPKLLDLEIIRTDTLLGLWRRGLSILYANKNQKYIDFGCRLTCSVLHSDTVWYGTEKGIFYRKLSTIETSEHIDFEAIARKEEPSTIAQLKVFEGKYVSSLVLDDDKRMWFAIKGEGVYIKDGGSLQKIQMPQIEFVNTIKIVDDRVLLCTNKGAFLSDKIERGKANYKWYKIEEREIQQAFTFNKKLYLVGSGLIFAANQKISNSENAQLIFRCRGLNTGKEFVASHGDFTVQHSLENLSFVFDRITYASKLPDLIYEVRGVVNQSGQSKANTIDLDRLPVGKYRIRVYPDVYEGEKLAIVLSLQVLPEWYETWITKLVIFLVAVAGLIFLLAFIINRNKKKDKERNAQEQLLLEYKLIALKAQVNPHFISNCLTAIQNLIAKGESEKANSYVARFGLLVRKILDYSGIPLITLEEELEVVKLYIQMEEVRFGRSFSFSLDISDEIDKSSVLVPSLLFNPIIENAIWHGLLPKSQQHQAKLDIVIKKIEEVLQITICDNGIGLANKRGEETQRKSYGLDITLQRLKNINYLLQSTAGKVEINNRKSETGEAMGVEVIICLPLENKY